MSKQIWIILLTCIITIPAIAEDITWNNETLPNYPTILRSSKWAPIRRANIDAFDGKKSGLTKEMKEMKVEYLKIDITKIAARNFLVRDKFTPEGIETYKDEAKDELKKVDVVLANAKKVKKLAQKLEKRVKKNKKATKDFKKHVKEVASTAKTFEKALKKVSKKYEAQMKQRVSALNDFLKRVRGEVLPNMKIGIDRAKQIVKLVRVAVQENDKKDFFDRNVQNAARPMTQGIGNVNKYKSRLDFKDMDDAQSLFDRLSEWSNDDRKVNDNGGLPTTQQELDAFMQVVGELEVWYNKNR